MNSNQENLLTMFNTVVAVCEPNSAVIASVPALDTAYKSFKIVTGEINDVALEQLLKIKGETVAKAKLKEALALHASVVARVLRAYAVSINDDVLREEIDYTESVLLKQRDVTIQLNAQIIYDRANTHIAVLGDFGITALVMSNLLSAITSYQAHLSSPTVARDKRAGATTELVLKIGEASDILRLQMDDLMQIIRLSESKFFRLYTNARKIINLHGKGSVNDGSIKGVVKDAETNLVVAGALVELLDSDQITSSDALGEFVFNLLPGTYSIRVSKDGYNEFELNDIVVVKNEDTPVDIVLDIMV